jgi:hypothetical protein
MKIEESYQFDYVGGPLSMLTFTWPHKNHWKLFDGSRDLKNMCWKAIVPCSRGFQKLLYIKKWGSKSWRICPRISVLPRTGYPGPLMFYTLISLSLVGSCFLALWINSIIVFDRLILPSVARSWSKWMYVWRDQMKLKYDAHGNISDISFFGSVILEHSSFHNVLNFFRM